MKNSSFNRTKLPQFFKTKWFHSQSGEDIYLYLKPDNAFNWMIFGAETNTCHKWLNGGGGSPAKGDGAATHLLPGWGVQGRAILDGATVRIHPVAWGGVKKNRKNSRGRKITVREKRKSAKTMEEAVWVENELGEYLKRVKRGWCRTCWWAYQSPKGGTSTPRKALNQKRYSHLRRGETTVPRGLSVECRGQ